jgi:hypothetical protein
MPRQARELQRETSGAKTLAALRAHTTTPRELAKDEHGEGARGEVREEVKPDGASDCGSEDESEFGKAQRHRQVIQRQPQHDIEASEAGCSRLSMTPAASP